MMAISTAAYKQPTFWRAVQRILHVGFHCRKHGQFVLSTLLGKYNMYLLDHYTGASQVPPEDFGENVDETLKDLIYFRCSYVWRG